MSDLPPPPPPPPAPPPPPPTPTGGGPRWQSPDLPPPPPPDGGGPADPGGTDDERSRTPWIVGALVAVLVLAGLGWVVSRDDDPAPTAAPSATPSPSTPAPSTPAPSTPAPSTPDATEDPASPDPGPSPSGNPLDDLLGEGGLGDLFGEEGLDDLLGGGGIDQDLLRCLAPDGAQPSLESTPLPDDPAEAIRTIGDQVADLRDLEFADPIDLELLSNDELADRVIGLTDEDYPVEDSDTDQAILVALGQADPDIDLRATYLDLLGEQVAGFYDPDSGELVAESAGDLAPADRIIVAHELDHALTDQALGLPDLDDDVDLDAILAQQALVEGDATVLMQQWAGANLSLVEQLSLAVPGVETQALDEAPYVLQQQLLYPYDTGLSFVCSQYNDGGWAAVDAMYDDLPTTTAQVLFPERYEDREAAVKVAPPSLDGATELRRSTWGAVDLKWLLEAPGDDPSAGPDDATDLVEDWAGGELAAWDVDGQTVVALRVAARRSGAGLCPALQDWADAAFPDATPARAEGGEAQAWAGRDRAGTITCDGDVVTAVVGSDLATVRRVG